MSDSPTPSAWATPARATYTVLFVCWLAILFEGYDVGVMGAVLPALAVDKSWNLTPMQQGMLGSYALAGMFVGSFAVGTLSDLLGRRRMLLACVTLFSLTMIGAAWAPTPNWFATFRFIGGLGLGGVIPVAAALTVEYSPPARRGFNYGVMYSGYSLGILCSAAVAMWLLSHWGWRSVIAVGALPLLLVPVLARLLPESLEYLLAKGDEAGARAQAAHLGITSLDAFRPRDVQGEKTSTRDVLAAVFAPRHLRATLCFWGALFLGMMLVYGLNTWLPQIMRKNGYDLGSSLSFLLVFSLASAIGGLLLGQFADKTEPRKIVALFFVLGAGGIYCLTYNNPLVVNYLWVALAGIGSISSSLILTGYLTGYFPAHARGAATGWALSFARIGAMCGPIVGGYLATLQLPLAWNFIAFSCAALLAAVFVILIPPRRAAVQAQAENSTRTPATASR
ncbi:aromatic acid/H+ symport family MFS transporter [Achromobacter sp. Marseille-Q0513]|uniref:MFS transporter n=1 Tax=Achromobacter sp. Marseille-Q0513 TaxID=2829161 RepID=UPI001BA15E2E|nr:aromatic acid/H+ symport family MFS transporter [Achromobacter sp. Marseille-Q0513]MBR8653168.1 aromatic acid/H+ symport family MFS transporter [Achromobacter sp. Marseille-Q0513]